MYKRQIISRERIEILPTDNVGDVHDKLMNLGATLTLDTVDHIIAGDLKTTPQTELLNGEEATPAPKIFKETCHIDWGKTSTEIHNLVRGLSPYPAAWAEIHDSLNPESPAPAIKIFSTQPIQGHIVNDLQPGRLSIDGNRMTVACGGNTSIEILELQPAGKRRMTASEFLRGARLPESAILK